MYSYEEALRESIEYFDENELAADVFVDKYALRDNDGNLLEKTPTDMHWRIAKEFARIEKNKFKKPLTEEVIFGLLDKFKYVVPQGSPNFGIGNNYQLTSLSNCYVLSSPQDDYGSILDTDKELVQISKRRGGVGLDISHLRPEGTPTKNSSRTSTGIVTFCERYSNSIREVGQANRRGALMLTLSVHHPQVLDFARMKLDETKVTGANVSLRITDEFMRAVTQKEDYEQRWPVDSDKPTISKMVNAESVWKEIIKCAHSRAEPGLLMWDNIIKESPADLYSDFGFNTVSTNPCCISKKDSVFVITSNGIKEIKDITSNDLVWINESREWCKTSGYFDSGKAAVYKVKFRNNTELTVTDNHKFVKMKEKREGTKIEYREGNLTELKDLKIKDKIAIHNSKIDDIYGFGNLGTYDEGLILGWLSGDGGCLSYHNEDDKYPSTILDFWEKEFDTGLDCKRAFNKLGYDIELQTYKTENKTRLSSLKFTEDFINKYEYNIWLFKSETSLNPFLFQASKDFIVGFLQNYFASDGTVGFNETSKNYNIQLSSINKNRLLQVKYILNLFGITSSVGLAKKAGRWRLTITGINNIVEFYNQIGINTKDKSSLLNKISSIINNRNSKAANYTEIKSIEFVGIEDVGCIEVDKYHKFTANGIISGNSELPLCIHDSCRLLLLNLFSYVKKPFTQQAYFDSALYYKHSKIAQRLMDDLVDLEIESIDKILTKAKKEKSQSEIDLWSNIRLKCLQGRRTGLGNTAIGDMLAGLNIKYGSEQSINTCENIYKLLKFAAYESSIEMAEEIGCFPIWNSKLEESSPFFARFKKEQVVSVWTREEDGYQIIEQKDGKELIERMNNVGRRNIAILTTAPAGTVSCLTRTTSGIEPAFKLKYTRRRKITHDDKDSKVDFVDKIGDKWTEYNVFHPKLEQWMEISKDPNIEQSPWYGCCAEDLDWTKRVELQAVCQKHIDHGISSTINLPKDVKEEEVAIIYEQAWKKGLKGVTIYRDGCRSGVLVDKSKIHGKIEKTDAPKRPKDLPSDTYLVSVKGTEYFVVVGLLNDEPYEVIAGKNKDEIVKKKADNTTTRKVKRGHYQLKLQDEVLCDSLTEHCEDTEEALTRMLSTSLRHGVDISFILHQLEKTKGDLQSFAKAIGRTLKKYVSNGIKVSGEECPNCGAELYREEGCVKCSCGWTKCS